MNAARLLAAFSKIGDEPDRIQQLRKIAVALAITGKLNGGVETLTPVEILGSVEQLKTRLVKQGHLPKQKQFGEVTEEHLPEDFSDPSRFAPLGALARIEKGDTGIQQALPGAFPLVVTAAERGTCDHYDFDGSAAIIPLVSSTGHGSASLNRLHYQEGKFALGTILVAVFPHDPNLISARFLFEYLSAFKDELLVSRMTGTANVTLSVGRIAEVPVPLVCPEVQRNVDALMALCDRLEAARADRESARDRLLTASLARLNAPDPDPATFTAHARFALGNLNSLTARPDQVKQLRQTILSLAVRGKLVVNDLADEHAPRLDQSTLCDIDPPFLIPNHWSWLRLGALGKLKGGGTPSKARNDFWNGTIPWVSPKDMKVDNIAKAQMSITNAAISSSAVNLIESESLLFVVRGMILAHSFPVAIARVPLTINQDMKALVLKRPEMVEYLLRAMKGLKPEMLGRVQRSSHGTCRIEGSDYSNFLVPIPPLAEQNRIVAKIDELMALCDRLEVSLTTGDETRRRLLEALLQEALALDVTQELELA